MQKNKTNYFSYILCMNALEAIAKLKECRKYEGHPFEYKNDVFYVRRVVAAPANLQEFTNNYRSYIENSEATVMLGLSAQYDIYFYDNPYKQPVAFFLRLKEFERKCLNNTKD